MKKAFCILFSLIMVISLCSCKKDSNKKDTDTVDIEYFANLGQIPECEFSLGESVSKIEEALTAKAEKDDEVFCDVIEGDTETTIQSGDYNYYCLKEKEDNGISYIVSYATAYGFEIGDVIIEIKDAISDIQYTEEAINDENAFFLYGVGDGSVLKCKFEKNTVMFVFQENALCATAIYETNDWE